MPCAKALGGYSAPLLAGPSPVMADQSLTAYACAKPMHAEAFNNLLRRGGRVAEGARLESVYAGNRIAGSNPAPSARRFLAGAVLELLFVRIWFG